MWSCVAQMGWTVFGPLLLLMLAILIAREPRWTLGVRDALFGAVALAVVGTRALLTARARAAALDGGSAARRELVRYSARFGGACVLVWVVAQSIHIFP